MLFEAVIATATNSIQQTKTTTTTTTTTTTKETGELTGYCHACVQSEFDIFNGIRVASKCEVVTSGRHVPHDEVAIERTRNGHRVVERRDSDTVHRRLVADEHLGDLRRRDLPNLRTKSRTIIFDVLIFKSISQSRVIVEDRMTARRSPSIERLNERDVARAGTKKKSTNHRSPITDHQSQIANPTHL